MIGFICIYLLSGLNHFHSCTSKPPILSLPTLSMHFQGKSWTLSVIPGPLPILPSLMPAALPLSHGTPAPEQSFSLAQCRPSAPILG